MDAAGAVVKPVLEKETTISGWCTKYALTQGIFKLEECIAVNSSHNAEIKYARKGLFFLEIGRNFFVDRDLAVKNAQERATRAILALDKKRAKLEAIKLTPHFRVKR